MSMGSSCSLIPCTEFGWKAWASQNFLCFLPPLAVIKRAQRSCHISYWECDSLVSQALLILRRFNLRKQLRKSLTKFLFPHLSFWTTNKLNLYTLLELLQIASKPGGQRHELKEHSQSWSFSPSHQMTSQICKGHCVSFPDYTMCAGHSKCLGLNWINCWNVPPTFMKGAPAEKRGIAAVCLRSKYNHLGVFI